MTNSICKFYTSNGELLEITTNNLQALKQLLNKHDTVEYSASMIIDDLNRLQRMIYESDVRILESHLQFYGNKLVNLLINDTSIYDITLKAKNAQAADLLLDQGQWYDDNQLQRISNRLILAIEQKDISCIKLKINSIDNTQYGPLILNTIKTQAFDILKIIIDNITDPVLQKTITKETTLISQLVPGDIGDTFRTALKGMCHYQQQETSLFNTNTLSDVTQLVSEKNITNQIKRSGA